MRKSWKWPQQRFKTATRVLSIVGEQNVMSYKSFYANDRFSGDIYGFVFTTLWKVLCQSNDPNRNEIGKRMTSP